MTRWLQLKEVPVYIKKRTSLEFGIAIIRQWITKGRKSDSGRTILLKATKRLGTWLTTEEYVDKFIEECGQ
jgi:hypothetical protein